MTPRPAGPKVRFPSWGRALLVRLKYLAYLVRRRLRKRQYPLLRLGAREGGAARTSQLLRDVKLCRTAEFDGHIYFSLTTPRWPSKPFDRMAANGGLSLALAGTPRRRHIDMAILAVTRRCPYACAHCYEYDNIAERDSVPAERWRAVVGELQRQATGVIVFSGGEPMTRYEDLVGLLEAGDKDLSDFHLHTSGYGVTPERAAALKAAGLTAAGVGLDDLSPERHDRLRGWAGAHEQAVAALGHFREAGVFPYVNMCLTRDLVRAGELEAYLGFLKGLGAGFVRFLEPKPWGKYGSAEADALFSEADRATVTRFYERAHGDEAFRDHPVISYEAYAEAPERLGCMMGGLSHLYVDSAGRVRPCVFLPVAFGNIMTEDFTPIFRRMRAAVPVPLHARCPSLQLAGPIRSAVARGSALPVPFELIRTDWEKMFEAGAGAGGGRGGPA
jgi:MoaA/NifB/PqqE/SkfB family radical SAM enzyme